MSPAVPASVVQDVLGPSDTFERICSWNRSDGTRVRDHFSLWYIVIPEGYLWIVRVFVYGVALEDSVGIWVAQPAGFISASVSSSLLQVPGSLQLVIKPSLSGLSFWLLSMCQADKEEIKGES